MDLPQTLSPFNSLGGHVQMRWSRHGIDGLKALPRSAGDALGNDSDRRRTGRNWQWRPQDELKPRGEAADASEPRTPHRARLSSAPDLEGSHYGLLARAMRTSGIFYPICIRRRLS